MTPRQGELFWIEGSEARGSMPPIGHPHLILQEDALNASRLSTVVVVALTTNRKRHTEPGNILLEAGEGSLPKQSVIVVSQVSSVEKSQLGKRIGMLAPERVQQVFRGLRLQQASYFREDGSAERAPSE